MENESCCRLGMDGRGLVAPSVSEDMGLDGVDDLPRSAKESDIWM